MKQRLQFLFALFALTFVLPLALLAQTTNILSDASGGSSGVTGNLVTDAGSIIVALMVVGAILKNAFPTFPNRLIPLITMVVGTVGYMVMSGSAWGDGKAWFAALLVAASATGIHSGIKNTFQSDEGIMKDAARKIGSFLLVGLLALSFGCATQWIDKVTQSRAAASKIGYRTVAEFNGWYSQRTNNPVAFNTTLTALNAQRTEVYTVSSNLSLSLLTLEDIENAYRLAPTNQNAVVSAVAAVSANASNIVNIVNLFTK